MPHPCVAGRARAMRELGPGLALSQVMQRTQLRLSTSCAGWEYTGQPAVSRPAGGSSGPPL